MSGRKDVLLPYQIFDADTMQADLESTPTNIQYLDNVAVQLSWTGNPTGTFGAEGSLNYSPRDPNSAIWTPITLNPVPTASGSADTLLMDLNQLSFPWIKVTYTNTFVSGSITTVADTAGSLNNTYFLLNTVSTYYYVWFSVNSMGVDPALPAKTGIQVNLATGATANAVAAAIYTPLALLTTKLSNVTTSTNHVYFNILALGGSAAAGTSGFTISNTDTTGVLDGYISAKMV